MRRSTTMIGFLALCASVALLITGGGAGCGKSVKAQDSLTDAAAGDAASAGVNEVSSALALSQAGLAAGQNAKLEVNSEEGVDGDTAALDEENANTEENNNADEQTALNADSDNTDQAAATLKNAQKACSDKDNKDVSLRITCTENDHSAKIVRESSKGCKVGDVVQTGSRYLAWSKLAANACPKTDQLPDFWTAVQSGTAELFESTDSVNPAAPTRAMSLDVREGKKEAKVGKTTIKYQNYKKDDKGIQSVDGVLTFDGTRIINQGKTKVADLTLKTTKDVPFTLQQIAGKIPTSNVVGGEVTINHNTGKFNVSETFKDVHYDYEVCKCHPISGTVDFIVTPTNTKDGPKKGTITFTHGTSNDCNTRDIVYDGRNISKSTSVLESCE